MGILKSRHEQPALEVDDLGGRTDQLGSIRPDSHDPPTGHGDSARARPRGIGEEDPTAVGAAGEDQIRPGHLSRRPSCGRYRSPSRLPA